MCPGGDGAPTPASWSAIMDPVLPSMTNPRADRVRRIRALTTPSGRRRQGSYLAEGPQAAREAVRHIPAQVRDLYLTVEASQRHSGLLDEATSAGVSIHLCSPDVIAAMSPDAQGVLGVLTHVDTDAHEIIARAGLLATLAEARDPGNAGTVIRAADAAGADGVLLSHGSVDTRNPKVVRSTAGSLFHLPVAHGGSTAEIVTAANEAGIAVLATAGTGDVSLDEAPLAQPTMWLFGNEAQGLTEHERSLADAVVRIPIYGAAESLNLAMAATLCLYASAAAQRGIPGLG